MKLNDELYAERLRVIEEEERRAALWALAFPSEEEIEAAISQMEERDFFGYLFRTYLKKMARWYFEDYPELRQLADKITPGESGTATFSEWEAKLLACTVVQFDAELRLRIERELQDDVRKLFDEELKAHRQGDVTGQHYLGPDFSAFVVGGTFDGPVKK